MRTLASDDVTPRPRPGPVLRPRDHDRPAVDGSAPGAAVVAGAGLAALVGCGSGDDGESTAATTRPRPGARRRRPGPGRRRGQTPSARRSRRRPPGRSGRWIQRSRCPGGGRHRPADIRPTSARPAGWRRRAGNARPRDPRRRQRLCPLTGAAVYVWHCDRDGRYSLYSPGRRTRTTCAGPGGRRQRRDVVHDHLPRLLRGRWPHIHFEVYASLADATGGGTALATSQLAIPEDACNQAYDADGYAQSVTNLAPLTLESDKVFADGTASGSPPPLAAPTTASPCASAVVV